MIKKVLLVMGRIPFLADGPSLPPLGLLYISASMKQAGISVFTLNLNLETGDIEAIMKKYILENDIDIVGTGGMIYSWEAMEEVLSIAKKIRPEIVTMIGGSLVTHSPEEALNLIPHADYGILGEGDVTDNELVFALQNGTDISAVDSIIYRDGNEYVLTRKRQVDVDVNAIAMPDYEGFGIFEMLKGPDFDEKTSKLIAPIVTSRSCPYQCTFCCRNGTGSYRVRDLDLIFSEMNYVIERFGVNEFRLSDELFAQDTQRVHIFCERIKKMNMPWEIFLRVGKHVTKELLEKMKDAGCVGIFYGLESAHDTVLKSMRKGTTESEILRVLTITKEAGIVTHGGFIFGDIAETKETVEYTMDFAEKHFDLLVDTYYVPIMLFPGTVLYNKAVEEGKITDTTQFIKDNMPYINISSMSDEDYHEMIFHTIPLRSSKLKRIHCLNSPEETLTVKDGKYQTSYTCKCCGNNVTAFMEPKHIFSFKGNCSSCYATKHITLSCCYMEEFKEEITRYLKQEKIAIWGMGRIFYDLFQGNSYLQENEIVLIDRSVAKQNIRLNKSTVFSPDIITEKGIETIVITTENRNYPWVVNSIEKDYPSVKNIVWVYDIGLLP